MGAKIQKFRETRKCFAENLQLDYREVLFVTLENAVDRLLRKLLREEADKPADGETAHHGDGSTVDGIDGIAHKHIDNRKTYTPDETSPDRGSGDATPVETQHEGSEERTCEGAP